MLLFSNAAPVDETKSHSQRLSPTQGGGSAGDKLLPSEAFTPPT